MPDTSSPIERSTEGMVDYNANSTVQRGIVDVHDATVRRLVETIGQVRPQFRIADYGCGPGLSTISAVRPAIEAYRALDPDGAIAVCHADQPGNDWNALFALVSGPDGYQPGGGNIRTEAAVGSFYERMLDDASVDLATCYAASHWLSHAVHLEAPGAVLFVDLEGAARRELEDLARSDWTRFLRLRAEELRPGGYLLVSTLAAVPDPAEKNGVAASGRYVYRAIQLVLQTMADDELIDQDILDRFVFALWFLTEAEARDPIEADPVLRDAYSIEQVSVRPAPINADDVYAQAVDDPALYARLYTGYMRGFADSSLHTQLFRPAACDDAHADALASDFYRRFETLYRDNPGTYRGELWELTAILRRR